MSTFDPKKKKGFAGEDRRGDRFGNYSRRDDSRSFDHDGGPGRLSLRTSVRESADPRGT